jgi:hypothetical protein
VGTLDNVDLSSRTPLMELLRRGGRLCPVSVVDLTALLIPKQTETCKSCLGF